MTGHYGWALAFTDHQRHLAVTALTGKAEQITQAAQHSAGNAHAAALASAKEYAELAFAFNQVGPDAEGDVLVSLPRDKWLLMTGWILGVTGDGDYPWFVAEFLRTVDRMTGLPGGDV